MISNKRIAYLDIAKGIGMILVVMGHVEYINPQVQQYIYAFHMPLFFLISGILIWEKREEEKSFKCLVGKKLKSIMLPYAIFSLLFFFIEGARLIIKDLDQWDALFRQLFHSFCLQGVSTLWFLPALFISELLFIGIQRKFNNGQTVGIVSIIVIITAVLNTIEKSLYLQYYESAVYMLLRDVVIMLLRNLFCVGLVCIGYYIGKYLMPKLLRGWQEILSMVLFAIPFYIIASNNTKVDLRYINIGNVPVYLLGAITGSMALLCLCRLLEHVPVTFLKRPLEYYGRNSLIVMVTHLEFRVLYCSIKLATLINNVWNNQVVFCIVIVGLVFIIEIPIIWVINRYFPFILGKKFKIS